MCLCPPAGPTPETVSDLWQMIWDVRPAVIVMLTKVNENGRVRTDIYNNIIVYIHVSMVYMDVHNIILCQII